MAGISMNSALFEQALLESERPVLVEFQAPWCGYCRRLAPIMAKITDEYSTKLLIGSINIDEEPALADREEIEVVPTLILYQNGRAIGSVVAPESRERIEVFLREALS